MQKQGLGSDQMHRHQLQFLMREGKNNKDALPLSLVICITGSFRAKMLFNNNQVSWAEFIV